MAKRATIAVTLLGALVLTAGCWDQNILERVGVTIAIGLDQGPDDTFLLTASNPVIETGAKEKVEVISTVGHDARQIRENLRRRAGRPVVGGKIQEVIFGEDLARKGISPYLEIFRRDPVNQYLAWLLVTEEKAQSLLQLGGELKDKPMPGFYLNQLVESAVEAGEAPETRVYQFVTLLLSPGIDPVAPLIRADKKDIQLVGAALFHGDRMTGKLDATQTTLLSLMTGASLDGRLTLPLHEKSGKQYITVHIVNNSRKIEQKLVRGRPSYKLQLQLQVELEEFHSDKLFDAKKVRLLEGELNRAIAGECRRVFKILQKARCDALGLGLRARINWFDRYSKWDWDKLYPQITAGITVQTTIQSSGIIE